jgi:hypothetical protein
MLASELRKFQNARRNDKNSKTPLRHFIKDQRQNTS